MDELVLHPERRHRAGYAFNYWHQISGLEATSMEAAYSAGHYEDIQ